MLLSTVNASKMYHMFGGVLGVVFVVLGFFLGGVGGGRVIKSLTLRLMLHTCASSKPYLTKSCAS